MADQMQDPTMQGAQAMGEESTEQGAGFTICIKVSPDGSVKVGTEPYAEEDEKNLSPVKNIKDAMSIALDIYKNQGQIPELGEGEEDFDSGFAPKSTPRLGAMTM